MKINRNTSLTLVCIILGIVIALQFKSININQKTSSFDTMRLDQLRDELILQKQSNEESVKRNYELKDENVKYENAKGNDSLIHNL